MKKTIFFIKAVLQMQSGVFLTLLISFLFVNAYDLQVLLFRIFEIECFCLFFVKGSFFFFFSKNTVKFIGFERFSRWDSPIKVVMSE